MTAGKQFINNLLKQYAYVLFIMFIPFCSQAFNPKVYKENGFWGVKDSDSIIIPAKYVEIEKGSNYYIAKTNVCLYGLFSNDGKILVPPNKFNRIEKISDDYFKVCSCDFGVVDKLGKKILDPIYTDVQLKNSTNGIVFVIKHNGFVGLADKTGSIVIPPNRFHAINIENNSTLTEFVCLSYGKGKYILNSNFEIIDSVMFKTDGQLSFDFVEDMTAMDIDGKKHFKKYRCSNGTYSVVDYQDNHIIDNIDDIGFVTNGVNAFFRYNNKEYVGLMDLHGRIIVSPQMGYTSITPLKDYLMARNKDRKCSIFLYSGEIIEKPNHLMAIPILNYNSDGTVEYCYISFKDNVRYWGIKDSKGNIILEPEWDDFNQIKLDNKLYFLCFKDGFVGLADTSGTIIFKPQYTSFAPIQFAKGYIKIGNGDYVGIGTLNGEIIIPPEKFDKINYQIWSRTFDCRIGNIQYIFDSKGNLKYTADLTKVFEAEEQERQGSIAFNNSDYKKAIDLYTQASIVNPSSILFYNIAAAYYNLNKYPEAIDYLNRCLSHRPSESTKIKAINLKAASNHYQKLKDNRKSEIAQYITAFAFTGIVSYFSHKASNRTQSSNNNSVSTGYSQVDRSEASDEPDMVMPKKKGKCGFCGGKGSTIEYVANFGIDKEPYCEECGKTVVSGHYHKTCTKCGGTGER